ncbi:two-component regulator propeller domain-containing protein [Tamlana sp. 2201CG12-4]|uniref:hybrid sensor histidine kinase/response regulator transcription factor n=1 Tax=Tamlana sp. 2201CG12-4 TaxID=3112582 RepID=UPI002DB883D1|nr:two-component regulator propeller domain-containing protein [Tamlana sp. 2201CG12-4]MEC3905521.1 two-component regulator propeller domain-containing protein [Tamlana sp. 2201CG12-4]
MKLKKTYIAFGVGLFCCLQFFFGQSQAIFRQISIEQGLSNNRITGVVQDSLGFIWIGTKNGLNKYDGANFKEYNQRNSKISSNDISVLHKDKKGRIWIGTVGGGINIYNPLKDEFKVYKNTQARAKVISSNDIHTIIEDKKGRIWLGTDKGIDFYEEGSDRFKTYQYQGNENSQNYISVWAILEATDGSLFLGTYGNGLLRFDTETEVFISIVPKKTGAQNPNFDFINTLLYLNAKELLIGTNGNGLLKYNLVTNETSNVIDANIKIEAPIVLTLKEDSNANIWVGTDGDGIYKITRENLSGIKLDQYTYDNRLRTSLSNNTVNDIFEDTQSNIWIGTAWKGINVIKRWGDNISFFFSDGFGYNAAPVLSVFKEGSKLWIGTDGNGLNNYDLETGNLIKYNSEDGLSPGGDYIQFIKKRDNGQYWIGTFANGLVLFDPIKGKVKQFKRNNLNNNTSLPYNDVRDIIEQPSGDLWIATWGGGLSFLDSKTQTFNNYRFYKGDLDALSSDNITSLVYDKGLIWVGTFGGGLNLFDTNTNKFIHYKASEEHTKSIGSDYIFDLLKDNQENLWIATKEGLNKFDKEHQTFEKFEVGNTTGANTIVSLIDDEHRNIWMGTKEGIFKYNIKSNKIEELEGSSSEFHVNSVYKDNQGILFFGGADGVTAFNPDKMVGNTTNPRVFFTDFKLFGKSVAVGEDQVLKTHISFEKLVVLKYNESVISFEFGALEYPFNKKMYAVKMDGFEDQWRNIGTQKTATYTNLSPGDYRFNVKAQNRDGSWDNENIAKVQIEILPPLWRTWWAYVIYSFLFMVLLWIIRHYTLVWAEINNNLKLEKLKREQEDKIHELKQRFFTNISHEIRTPLTLIIGTINSLMKSNFNTKDQKQLTNLKRSTGRLMNLVSELLNIRKLETGNIKLDVSENDITLFIHEIFLAFSQHAIANNIHYKFVKPEYAIHVWFDKIQLEKTIYNLLTNAFKFTSSGDKIEVSVFQKEDDIHILVRDSGQGIPENKQDQIFERFYQNEDTISESLGFGIGLSIVKNIIELHSGTISVKSTEGLGSEFIITLPLGKSHFKEEQIILNTSQEDQISNYNASSALEKNAIDDEFVNANVLIVEDNVHLLEYLSDLLSEDFNVIKALNGEIGLELAKEKVPDIIISDVMMPVMDGITLCSNIKSNLLTSHIPVILLTARTMVEDIMEGFEMGADDYLVKPFNEEVLKVRINNLLHIRKQLRAKYINEALLSPKEIAFASPDQEFLVKLNEIIEQHIDVSEFNVEDLSVEMAMSHSNLYKKIKALTGMTTVAFIRDFRLNRAAQFLKKDKIAIIDVCFKVGYTDRRHFSQEFKKKFGITPSAYAKENLA